MKNPNSKYCEFGKIVIMVVLIVIMSACENKPTSSGRIKEIVVRSNCSSDEIVNDLEYSVNQIKDKLTNKQIKVTYDTISKDCGYLFVDGERKKIISTVLTDLELTMEVDKFYK